MKYLCCVLCLLTWNLIAEENIERLAAGNARFLKGGFMSKELIVAQSPFCAILACADSRVAPEIIFDQRLGDLFVIRIAGNVASQEVIESLDYAVNTLKVDVIVVMGHQNCGAVSAVFQNRGDTYLGSIASMIQPSTQHAHSLQDAIMANINAQVAIIKKDPHLQKALQEKKLEIIGAYYNFDTGIVDFYK